MASRRIPPGATRAIRTRKPVTSEATGRRRGHVGDPGPTPAERRRFRALLLKWYWRNGRDLPWRRTDDPYHILVSEVMLQQTQVERVLPKYAEWLEKYPSLESLAAAPVEDVVKTWYPLGYNIRPRRLHAIARESVERYGGRLPSESSTLQSFKGIGSYTAGAILSFAFRQRAPILDTNVARVLFRVFIGRGEPKAHRMRKTLWAISAALVPARHAFDFNQALMDFGAMVCIARKPRCLVCPMASMCRAFPFNPENEAPSTRGARRAPAFTTLVTAAVVERAGRFLITRRPEGTHLAGCWEFPGGKCEAGEDPVSCLAREIHEELDSDVVVGEEILRTLHSYPDRSVELRFFRCVLDGTPKPLLGQEVRWASREELRTLSFPPADRELIELLAPQGQA